MEMNKRKIPFSPPDISELEIEEVAKALTREELIIYAKRLEEQIRSQMIWEKSKYIGRAILLWKIIKEHYYIF